MAQAPSTPKIETITPAEEAIPFAADKLSATDPKLEKKEITTLIESKLKMDQTLSNENTAEENQDLYVTLAAKVAQEIVKELGNKDSQFLAELKNIVKSIDTAKDEISAIRPKELAEKDLPDAANSLDIIIQTSEEACSNILACGEELMEIAEFVPSKLNERLMEISTKLFESSNFDDLNGQRIRKVIKILHDLENRLKNLLAAYGESYETVAAKTDEKKKTADEELLNGPQDAEEAASQDEIDAILNGF
ncbi:MAG: protein phosphatase CheZ [Alphaproteobacteria bacterium]|nr:protein phosphatase CheZ [Alphaproteobacteria bacterium]NCQ66236.1 protein phosphatase CheZ [Alphaproteobacteria bacterium]NCT06584.1 protein phosphatase CheZ [Alphaproteobacteria bacterium]